MRSDTHTLKPEPKKKKKEDTYPLKENSDYKKYEKYSVRKRNIIIRTGKINSERDPKCGPVYPHKEGGPNMERINKIHGSNKFHEIDI